jgi:hypothetical protein
VPIVHLASVRTVAHTAFHAFRVGADVGGRVYVCVDWWVHVFVEVDFRDRIVALISALVSNKTEVAHFEFCVSTSAEHRRRIVLAVARNNKDFHFRDRERERGWFESVSKCIAVRMNVHLLPEIGLRMGTRGRQAGDDDCKAVTGKMGWGSFSACSFLYSL